MTAETGTLAMATTIGRTPTLSAAGLAGSSRPVPAARTPSAIFDLRRRRRRPRGGRGSETQLLIPEPWALRGSGNTDSIAVRSSPLEISYFAEGALGRPAARLRPVEGAAVVRGIPAGAGCRATGRRPHHQLSGAARDPRLRAADGRLAPRLRAGRRQAARRLQRPGGAQRGVHGQIAGRERTSPRPPSLRSTAPSRRCSTRS